MKRLFTIDAILYPIYTWSHVHGLPSNQLVHCFFESLQKFTGTELYGNKNPVTISEETECSLKEEISSKCREYVEAVF
jgi:hypothetical protein